MKRTAAAAHEERARDVCDLDPELAYLLLPAHDDHRVTLVAERLEALRGQAHVVFYDRGRVQRELLSHRGRDEIKHS